MTQWHPIFANLLRPLLEDYYDVSTNVAVGDVPREADIVLVRRASPTPAPFQGLWKDLTEWNVLEYKGPTVAARVEHLDLLLELGLGIHRRLNEDRSKHRRSPIEVANVSFWYLVEKISNRFLSVASQRIGNLEQCGQGVWRGHCVERSILLVSASELAVEADSLPLKALGTRSANSERELGRLLAAQPKLWRLFGEWYGGLHPHILDEVGAMAKAKNRLPVFDPSWMIEQHGPEEALRRLKAMGAWELVKPKEQKRLLSSVIAAYKETIGDLGPNEKRAIIEISLSGLTKEEWEEIKQERK